MVGFVQMGNERHPRSRRRKQEHHVKYLINTHLYINNTKKKNGPETDLWGP